jgi:Gas vesicle synthesis protein GvpO
VPGGRKTPDKHADESYDDEEYDDEEYEDEAYGDEDDDEDYGDEPDEARRRARAPVKERREERQPREALSPDAVTRAAVRDIAELTGKQSLGITSLKRTDSGWEVEVEVLEDRRIPSSSDILGLYRAEIGADGSLVEFRRIRRYPRGKGDSSEVA